MIGGQVGVVCVAHPVVADADQRLAVGLQPGVARAGHIGPVVAVGGDQLGAGVIVSGNDHRRAGHRGGSQPGQDAGDGHRLVAFGDGVRFHYQSEGGGSGGGPGCDGNGGRGGGGEVFGGPLLRLAVPGSARHRDGDRNPPHRGGSPGGQGGGDPYGFRVVGVVVFGNGGRADGQGSRIRYDQRVGDGQLHRGDVQPGRPTGQGQGLRTFRLRISVNDQIQGGGGAGRTGRDGNQQDIPGLEVGAIVGRVVRSRPHRHGHPQIAVQGGGPLREGGGDGDGGGAGAGGRFHDGNRVRRQVDDGGQRVGSGDGEGRRDHYVASGLPDQGNGFIVFGVPVVAHGHGQGGVGGAGVGRDGDRNRLQRGVVPRLRLVHIHGGRIIRRTALRRILRRPHRHRHRGGRGGRGDRGLEGGGHRHRRRPLPLRRLLRGYAQLNPQIVVGNGQGEMVHRQGGSLGDGPHQADGFIGFAGHLIVDHFQHERGRTAPLPGRDNHPHRLRRPVILLPRRRARQPGLPSHRHVQHRPHRRFGSPFREGGRYRHPPPSRILRQRRLRAAGVRVGVGGQHHPTGRSIRIPQRKGTYGVVHAQPRRGGGRYRYHLVRLVQSVRRFRQGEGRRSAVFPRRNNHRDIGRHLIIPSRNRRII